MTLIVSLMGRACLGEARCSISSSELDWSDSHVMLASPSKYAVRALRFLKRQPPEQFVRVEEIAESTGIPGPYLSKVMKLLGQAGIIESRRGAQGGVRLPSRPPPLSVFDVCVATSDPVLTATCLLSHTKCDPNAPCPMHGEWGKLRSRLIQFLKRAKVF